MSIISTHPSRGRWRSVVAITTAILFAVGCGPTDYQKPIQQFSDASAVVAASAASYFNNMNTVEQEALVDRLAFESKSIDLAQVDSDTIISPAEISLRSQAISILSAYTSNLGLLASGSDSAAIGKSTTDLSASLKKIGTDAGAFNNKNIDNTKFSGMASAAASVIGAVAQQIVDHKARRDIEVSVENNQKPVEDLIDLIGQELTGAYERQKETLDAQSIYLSKAYSAEQSATVSDTAKRLALASKINAYRRQKELLRSADPTPAVTKMKNAFVALVAYARSDKDPKTIAALWQSVQDFTAAAQPLGQAIQSLVAAS
jgi:hypothetical protein